MVAVRSDDILAGGLILNSIFLFFISLSLENKIWLKIVGIVGAILLFGAESVYIVQKINRTGG